MLGDALNFNKEHLRIINKITHVDLHQTNLNF